MHLRTIAAPLLLVAPIVVACSVGSSSAPATTSAVRSASPVSLVSRARSLAQAHVDRTGRPVARGSKPLARTRTAAAGGGASTDPPIPAKYQAFAEAFEAEMNADGVPGSAVAILEHGEVTFAHGFGVKGPNSTEPVDARTLFRYGSMNKALTATAVLQLVDEGKLTVGDTVSAVIPDVALTGPYADHITVNDLLSQQSDLFDFTNYSLDPDLSNMNACPAGPNGLREFVTGTLFAKSEYSLAPPQTLWLYSNPNYVLAGSALESVSHGYYADEMRQRVFAPLGMTRTFFDPAAVLADGDYTDGLSTNADGSPWDVAPDSYDCAWLRPAGLGFTSVLEYAKFVQFLYAGNTRVLSARSRELMQSPVAPMYVFGDNDSYGYGLEVRGGQNVDPQGFYRTKVISHAGAIAGYASEFFFFPETGFAFIAFSNADGGYPLTSYFEALKSFSGLRESSPTTPVEYTPDAGTFPGYAGTFEDTSGILGTFTVTDHAGVFSVSIPTLDALGIVYEAALQPYVLGSFLVNVDSIPDSAASTIQAVVASTGIELSFQPGPDGQFEWIDISTGLAGKRVADRGR